VIFAHFALIVGGNDLLLPRLHFCQRLVKIQFLPGYGQHGGGEECGDHGSLFHHQILSLYGGFY